jgi:hypothetical protein
MKKLGCGPFAPEPQTKERMGGSSSLHHFRLPLYDLTKEALRFKQDRQSCRSIAFFELLTASFQQREYFSKHHYSTPTKPYSHATQQAIVSPLFQTWAKRMSIVHRRKMILGSAAVPGCLGPLLDLVVIAVACQQRLVSLLAYLKRRWLPLLSSGSRGLSRTYNLGFSVRHAAISRSTARFAISTGSNE